MTSTISTKTKKIIVVPYNEGRYAVHMDAFQWTRSEHVELDLTYDEAVCLIESLKSCTEYYRKEELC